MELAIKNQDMTTVLADVLVLGIFEDDKNLNEYQSAVDNKLGLLISDYFIKKEDFGAKFNQTISSQTFLKIPSSKVMLVGLGKKKQFSEQKMIELGSSLHKVLNKMPNTKNVAIELFGTSLKGFDAQKYTKCLAQGMLISSYDFDKYKSKKEESKLKKIKILINDSINEKEAKLGLNKAQIINDSMNFAKDLVNEPADVATPEYISKKAVDFSKDLNLECTIYDKKELEKMNFNAFLAVSKGSDKPPKFIHVVYKPEKVKRKIALIGKGITFDSGGLNIKPAGGMLTMKSDMSGSASVLGIIQAIAKLKPDVEVHAMCALCENMLNGIAYKQGDVLKAKNGMTIEVDNTDAEGRLTLADVLTYADDLMVDEVIDIATLTGAMVVALGNSISGILGNNDDLIKRIINSGKNANEMLWQMPIYEESKEAIKSDIADMKNTGARTAGCASAAKFLSNFTKSKSWAHIDIAGTAFLDKPFKELNKGPSGVMVRTIIDYITSI